MIDIEKIRNDTDMVVANLKKRRVGDNKVRRLFNLDKEWRKKTKEVEKLRSRQNESQSVLAKEEPENKDMVISEMRKLSDEISASRSELKELAKKRNVAWRALPNLVFEDVPVGDEDCFELVRSVPEKIAEPGFQQKSYLELTVPKMVDVERAAKVSGSRFVYIKGEVARLQMALVSYVFDLLMKEGFTAVLPPVMIRKEAMAGMGYLDNHSDEIYKTQDDLYLVGTSEQSVGPMHMDEIIDEDKLPVRYAGYSSCFRREVGSHGQDVKGMLRVHQFDKVEMFSFSRPDRSEEEHDYLLGLQEKIMKSLKLPYRVIKLASEDLGWPVAKTYDIETWMPGENKYRETHSTSNTTDYQARRLNVRYRSSEGVVNKLHMLNGTAVAVGRILIALIENHQRPDGTMAVPDVLRSYLPFDVILFGAEGKGE